MPTALITGITGQDGSYLAEFLLEKGYRVVGVVRRSSTTPYERIAHLVDRIELVSADLLDQTSLTDGAARIKLGLARELRLGNLDARRDWGFAGDYVRAMWSMLQQPTPDDFVIATGETHSVREFCEAAFAYLGLDAAEYVRVDPALIRPAEVDLLVGDARRARTQLGWTPSVSFEGLVRMMVDADIARLEEAIRHGKAAALTPVVHGA